MKQALRFYTGLIVVILLVIVITIVGMMLT
jgi:hypothetical protein